MIFRVCLRLVVKNDGRSDKEVTDNRATGPASVELSSLSCCLQLRSWWTDLRKNRRKEIWGWGGHEGVL